MAKAGRKPTPEQDRQRIIEHVLAELSAGRSVARIFREDENLCDQATFWRWHFADEDLRGKVADARANGVEAILDETLEIADDGRNDTYLKELDSGKEIEVTNPDVIQRSKLRVDTRHKYAQMIAPRKYGPKLDLTSGGEKLGLADRMLAAERRLKDGEK